MIRDLEELLLAVVSDLSREYLREAIRCYHAAAFRAAVVLSVSATMNDLRHKINDLTTTGAGRGVADLSADIAGKYAQHEAWERALLDGCKKNDVLSPPEYQRLLTVVQIRHLCAHPSGHRGSAEEARDVIATCVDLVLSRPAQLGGKEIEVLVDKLGHPNFFGTADAAAVRETTQSELMRFRANALPGVAHRLLTILTSEAEDATIYQHAARFLQSMVTLEAPANARRLAWTTVAELVTSAGDVAALAVIAADPPGLRLLDPLARYRVLGIVRNHLNNDAAQTALGGWIAAGALDEDEKKDLLARLRDEFLTLNSDERNQAAHAKILRRASRAVARVHWQEFANDYVQWIIDAAYDGDFYIENAVIDHVMNMPEEEAARFAPAARARLVANILQAAEHGARVAEDACRKGLGARNDFVRGFYDACTAGTIEFPAQAWEWTEMVLQSCAEADLAVKLATAIIQGQVACSRRKYLLWNLSSSENPTIAELGEAAHNDEDEEQDDSVFPF